MTSEWSNNTADPGQILRTLNYIRDKMIADCSFESQMHEYDQWQLFMIPYRRRLRDAFLERDGIDYDPTIDEDERRYLNDSKTPNHGDNPKEI